MKQTRLMSLLEVLLNIGSGFIVAMLVWHFIIPEFFPRMAGPVGENLVVTTIFTVISITRSYIWRRLFNNGLIKSLVRCWKWIRVRVVSESPSAGDNSGKIGGGHD